MRGEPRRARQAGECSHGKKQWETLQQGWQNCSVRKVKHTQNPRKRAQRELRKEGSQEEVRWASWPALRTLETAEYRQVACWEADSAGRQKGVQRELQVPGAWEGSLV